MSNFICPTCGLTNIDCGKDGYKTDREIELEKKLEIATEALENIGYCKSKIMLNYPNRLICWALDALKKIKEIEG